MSSKQTRGSTDARARAVQLRNRVCPVPVSTMLLGVSSFEHAHKITLILAVDIYMHEAMTWCESLTSQLEVDVAVDVQRNLHDLKIFLHASQSMTYLASSLGLSRAWGRGYEYDVPGIGQTIICTVHSINRYTKLMFLYCW